MLDSKEKIPEVEVLKPTKPSEKIKKQENIIDLKEGIDYTEKGNSIIDLKEGVDYTEKIK